MAKHLLLTVVTLIFFVSFSVDRLYGQHIDFTIRFNVNTAKYEVYGKPNFDDSFFFVGGGNQVTIVFPQLVNDAPIAIQTVNGGVWLDNSQIYAPAASPSNDFHSIASNGSGVNFVNGQELLLFTFSLNGGGCAANVRLFENATDPQSTDPGMAGGDFNNYFANVFDFINYYNANYDNDGTICLVPPMVSPTELSVPQDSLNTLCMSIIDPNVGDTFTTLMCSPTPANGVAVSSLNGDELCVTYTPNLGFIGEDEICITICDQLDSCSNAIIPVTVVPETCPDADNDGICDQLDNCVAMSNPDQADCDGDGVGDLCELDSDADGVPDACDVCTGNDTTGDTDGDGICDDIDNCVVVANSDQADCDGDGEGDLCESDSDADGVPDACDVCTGSDTIGDTDGDGICDDIDNCVVVANSDQADCDGDGEGDLCEADDDSDGVPDACDVCTGDDTTGDTDGDGICDDIDNCLFTSNPDQADCDGDGQGNICETDADSDGVPDGCDLCTGDDTTGDTDGDGICDNIDNCIFDPNPAQADCDGDGEGDICEMDSDGDSVPDACDICIGNDAFGDDDGDGICNVDLNCQAYEVQISNDGEECTQPFTDVNLSANVIGDNVNLDYYTFSWAGPNTFQSSSQNPILPNITNDDSGTYSVTVTNTLTNCQYTLSTVVDVTVIPNEPQITSSSELVCIGSNFILSIPEYNGTDVHYEWVGPDGSTSSGAYADQSEIVISNFQISDVGSYRVTVIVDECSSLASSIIQVQVQPPLNPPVILGLSEVCLGGLIDLSTNTLADEYFWTGPNGFTSDLANPTVTNSANIEHVGEYRLVVVLNGCISPITTVQVTLSESAEIPILEVASSICLGGDIVLTALGQAAASYQWIAPSASPNSSFGILGDPNNVIWTTEPTTIISSTSHPEFYEEGMWRVVALNTNGCVSEPSVPLNVSIFGKPDQAIVNSEGNVCEREPIYLHADPVTDVTYKWYEGSPAASPPGQLVATGNDPILFNVSPGLHEYFVEAERNGCQSDTYGRVDVMVEEKPTLELASNEGPFCLGELIRLNASTIPGATYYWYGPNEFTSNTQNPVISNASFEDEGTYLLYVEVDGCASDPLITEVQISQEINVPVAINNGPICEGSDLLLSVTNVDPTLTYEWFDSIGSVSVGFGAELYFEEANMEMEGTYYVVATSGNCISNPSQNNNSGENAFTNVVVEWPDSDLAYVGDPLFACENSITINALPTTTGTGIWRINNGGPNTTILQPGQASSLVIDLQEGENELVWSVTSNSCGTISSDTLLVEWNNSPVAEDDVFEIEYNESLDRFSVVENDSPNTDDFEINIVSDVENGSLVLLDDHSLTYWHDGGFIGTETFTYQICQNDCPDRCDEAIVSIRVGTEEECEAASVITPNADGFNDEFIITCIPSYPGSVLSIFNRWGDEIYFSPDYQNDWRGTHEGEDLPTGTYYYNLKLNDDQKTKMSGYIYIEK